MRRIRMSLGALLERTSPWCGNTAMRIHRAFVCAMIGLLCSCGTRRPLRIGFVAGLSGIVSDLGVSARNGVELAVADANNAGGVRGNPVELVVMDDRNDPETAVARCLELKRQGVSLVIGPLTSGMADRIVPFANENDMLLVSPTVTVSYLSGIDDSFIRVVPAAKVQGEMLADTAAARGLHSFAVLYEEINSSYSLEVCAAFESRILSLGGEVSHITSFRSGAYAMMAELAVKARGWGADGILSVAGASDNALFCQYLRKNGVSAQLFAGMWSMTADLIRNGGAAVEGLTLVSMYDADNDREPFLRFLDTYRTAYKDDPSFASLFGYEAAAMLIQAMREAKSPDADSVKSAVLRIGGFPGLQGDFSIDASGDSDRPYAVYTVKEGRFVKADEGR